MQCNSGVEAEIDVLTSHKLHEKKNQFGLEKATGIPVTAYSCTGVMQTIFTVGPPFLDGPSAGRTLRSFPCSCHLVPVRADLFASCVAGTATL